MFNPTTINSKIAGPTFTVFIDGNRVCLDVEGIVDTFEMDPETAMEVGGCIHQAAQEVKFLYRKPIKPAVLNSENNGGNVA